MVDAWPEDLPQRFKLGTVQNGSGDSRIRSQPDAGPAIIRARTSAVVDPLSGSMVMTTAQWTLLQTFGKLTLIGWSLPFTFPDVDTADPILVRFGEALPSRSYHSLGNWTVSIALEVLP